MIDHFSIQIKRMKEQKTSNILEAVDHGIVSYGEGLRIQEDRVFLRLKDKMPDALLLLEHMPVFTLGVSACEKDLLWDAGECKRRGIDLKQTTRGGKITFHGPGQLVGYPIIKLKDGGREVVKYVSMLEDVLIAVLQEFGINGRRDKRNRGIWTGNDKIAAIGVKVSRSVTFHGFALNVNP